MSQKKRKYQDNYLDFGFTYLIEDDLQIPQCVVCMKTFSNSNDFYWRQKSSSLNVVQYRLIPPVGLLLFTYKSI